MLSRYDLLANVVHDGKAGEGSYRCHIHRKVHCCCVGACLAPSHMATSLLLGFIAATFL